MGDRTKESEMTERTRTFLRGMASIVDICPDPARYEALLPKGTPEERLRRYWERVGEHLWSAMGTIDGEAARKARKAGIAEDP